MTILISKEDIPQSSITNEKSLKITATILTWDSVKNLLYYPAIQFLISQKILNPRKNKGQKKML
jgi:hypothetical protein